jgi:glycosyltransferase involved in cell wall biosynthesis
MKLAIVIPAYNEQRLIGPTIDGVPSYVDAIVTVNDGSKDNTSKILSDYATKDSRVQVINHPTNLGLGHALITGYKYCITKEYDAVIVVGGDNQMPLNELERFLDPIANDEADYTKGNRFLTGFGNIMKVMPKARIWGNVLLSTIEKPATGYWKIFDAHDGYTVINKRALKAVNWDKAWTDYAYNVDFLARLNVARMRVKDICRTPIYIKGERQSQIRTLRYMLMAIPLIVRTYLWRIYQRYIARN